MFNLNYNYNKFMHGNEAKIILCQTHTDPIKKTADKYCQQLLYVC